MEAVYNDYQDKINFFYVYKTVEHTSINGFVAPFDIDERLKHIAIAKERFQTQIPWICDTMENDVKHAFGGAPNGEVVLDPDGKIVRKRFWSDAKTLRSDLEELVGKSAQVTKIADLPAAFKPNTNSKIASGVVPKIDLPKGLRPLKMDPIPDDDDLPFYAKLRVESTQGAEGLGNGKTQLHCVLYLDPIHEVHWNNRAANVQIDFEGNEDISFEADGVAADRVEEDADIDPRHFLINMDAIGIETTSFRIKVSYAVCDNAETFCIEAKQEYQVYLEFDKDGGTRPGIFLNEMFGTIRDMDKNGDGDLSRDELKPMDANLIMGHLDYNMDDLIEKAEIDQFMKMFNNGRGVGKNDGEKSAEASKEKANDDEEGNEESESDKDEDSKKH